MTTEWITWPQAAEVVGCRLPTIDYNQRIGRIKSRPFHGKRPTLDRQSVEEFARPYADRDARRRAARKARPRRRRPVKDGPPEPTGWATTKQAAEVLGCGDAHVALLVRRGTLAGVRTGRRRWVQVSDLQALVTERAQWVSYATAAAIASCSYSTVQTAVRKGQIERRDVVNAMPSLRRTSVDEWAQRRRRPKPKRKRRRRRTDPPDDHYEWEPPRLAAPRIGVSESRVRQLARADLVPVTALNGRWWFRIDLLEQVAAARSARDRLLS